MHQEVKGHGPEIEHVVSEVSARCVFTCGARPYYRRSPNLHSRTDIRLCCLCRSNAYAGSSGFTNIKQADDACDDFDGTWRRVTDRKMALRLLPHPLF